MTEEWKDIKDYEGLYQVSNCGRMMSLNYRKTGKSKLMKLMKTKKGYLTVVFHKNGEYKKYLVHRLVAETFLENPDKLPQVNHKDEDKTNNFVFLNKDGSVNKEKSNLEWSTPKENSNHGTRNERISSTNTNGKLSKSILQLTLTGHLIREWVSMAECTRNGFRQSAVCRCCRGEKPQYKGFKWCYA